LRFVKWFVLSLWGRKGFVGMQPRLMGSPEMNVRSTMVILKKGRTSTSWLCLFLGLGDLWAHQRKCSSEAGRVWDEHVFLCTSKECIGDHLEIPQEWSSTRGSAAEALNARELNGFLGITVNDGHSLETA
jgi:hypothetical protein